MTHAQYQLLFPTDDEASSDARRQSHARSFSSIFEDGTTVLELIFAFAVAMSSSTYRPFRLTATLTLLAIMDSLAVICNTISKELSTMQRTSKGKKGSNNDASVNALHEQKVEAENCMMQLFKS